MTTEKTPIEIIYTVTAEGTIEIIEKIYPK